MIIKCHFVIIIHDCSLNSLLLMLCSFKNSDHPCRLDVSVKQDNSDSYATPFLQDIERYMYNLIRGIPESCRQVTRSMRGSCLEVPPQFVSHGVCQEIFEYSFFMNVSRNFFVKNLIIEANEVVLHDFSQICRLVHDIKLT